MNILDTLNSKIRDNSGVLEKWFERHHENILIPLYSSVDIRVSQNKIVPVDTNIFPAGFNNISENFRINTGELFKNSLNTKYPGAKKILIVPELHTKNAYYWENIYVIKSILENEDYEVRIGIVSDSFETEHAVFKTISGLELNAWKAKSSGNKIVLDDFVPDIILLNNDFSERCPKTLRDIVQPVVPPVEMGWHTRRKDVNFEFYNSLAAEVAEIIGIDPWVISIETCLVENVDFDIPDDRKRAAECAKKVWSKITAKYNELKITDEPTIFIKSNSGTYGMAVINLKDIESLILMNSSNRKRLRVTKGGMPVRDVVIQEGVPTIIKTNDGSSAEPVIYMVEDNVAGVFYRVNAEKSETDNLNSKGMRFEQFENTVSEINTIPEVFTLVSKIAVIAAGYEIEKIIRDGGCKEAVS
jgi:glutamate--cysteine ligase